MKEKTHPQYQDITVECACGATYQVGSTLPAIRVDICANCHPLFTGKEKLMDAEGRVEKFRKRYSTVSAVPRIKKAPRTSVKTTAKPIAKAAPKPAAKPIAKTTAKAS